MEKKYKIRLLFAAGIITVILLLRFFRVGHYINLDYIIANKARIQNLVEQDYLFAVTSFIIVYAVIVILLLPITIPINIGAGYFFGVFPATLYIMSAVFIGATTVFFVVRHLIGEYLSERYGKVLKNFNQEFEKYGATYLLSLHFFPITPFALINIVAALSSISIWTFMWTTIVGIIPGTLVYTFAGRQLIYVHKAGDILSPPILFALFLLVLLSFVPHIVRKYLKKNRE